MPAAYLSLGSNLGDRRAMLDSALVRLGENGVEILAVSSFIETAPYGRTGQPAFLNCAAKIRTALTARQLLALALETEAELGRTRVLRWGPRTIDIDIIFYGDEIINTPELTVPHYDAHNRAFVLGPLCELDPDLIHPVLKISLSLLLRRLQKTAPRPQDK
ncbi:MAG: 2-amino-4-hydroxy-6-hydroxymethyldihydropteridine diphosphokinase [Elusimicrobiaceae bacterium]|nr:2-amino-4-hydroxy-6-hydroxymethyldihydropteridine diphosphokinase [Elusimicrobiaceae bacterium]